MPWIYVQRSGSLYDPDGDKAGSGYSGHGAGCNNPAMQATIRTGPCPCGMYSIGPVRRPIDHLGPLAMPLMPYPKNQMFGRSAFFMHGDNAAGDHSASDGCLIFNHAIRQMVDESDDDQLHVVAEEKDVGH